MIIGIDDFLDLSDDGNHYLCDFWRTKFNGEISLRVMITIYARFIVGAILSICAGQASE
jgi:hypothetical protein